MEINHHLHPMNWIDSDCMKTGMTTCIKKHKVGSNKIYYRRMANMLGDIAWKG